MKIRWRGKRYIFGRKAKARYEAEVKTQLAAVTRLTTKKPDPKSPIDLRNL
jgi:hypothetical protein